MATTCYVTTLKAMNMVQVYIKGQEDKELSSFLRYYPVRIKNIGMDAFFDRQVVYDFKDDRNHADVVKCVAKMLIKVVGERTAVHGTKVKKDERAKRLKEKNNIEVDANFFKNKIVCIWDDVVTTGTSFCAYTAQLEQVGAHVTNGIFLGKTSYKYVQQ
jgi:orotate phosphoribosyltransferase-like protein